MPDGWQLDDSYRDDRAMWESLEAELLDRLGYGTVAHVAGIRVVFRQADKYTPEQILDACFEMRSRLAEIQIEFVHPWIRHRYADAYLALADRFREHGHMEAARDADSRYLKLLPDWLPDATWWFDDAYWTFGVNEDEIANALDHLAEIADNENRRESYLNRAESWRKRKIERDLRLVEWTCRQTSEHPGSSGS